MVTRTQPPPQPTDAPAPGSNHAQRRNKNPFGPSSRRNTICPIASVCKTHELPIKPVRIKAFDRLCEDCCEELNAQRRAIISASATVASSVCSRHLTLSERTRRRRWLVSRRATEDEPIRVGMRHQARVDYAGSRLRICTRLWEAPQKLPIGCAQSLPERSVWLVSYEDDGKEQPTRHQHR